MLTAWLERRIIAKRTVHHHAEDADLPNASKVETL